MARGRGCAASSARVRCREQRTLSAALKFYCGKEHVDAHGSEADVIATIKVLNGQLEKYRDLPKDVDGVVKSCIKSDPSFVDPEGKLRWRNGEVTIGFGQKNGISLKDMADEDPSYLSWIMRGQFNSDVKRIVKRALAGDYMTKDSAKKS